MHWLVDQIEQHTPGGYAPAGPLAVEPTAWAALALVAAGRNDVADRAAQWLVAQQLPDGAVPVTAGADGPHWTTSLALLAWQQIDARRFAQNIDRAAEWLLATKGKTNPQHPYIGHNTMLVGWSWAANTHSWLEPTAFATMALTAAGYADHPRTREGLAILVDRLLPGGGCNYGNTQVLGQTLIPHVQPSGIALWALAGQPVDDPRIALSLDYLEREVTRPTGCASLAYALISLTAWGRRPNAAAAMIEGALQRPTTAGCCYKLALLALASQQPPPFAPTPSRRVMPRRSDQA